VIAKITPHHSPNSQKLVVSVSAKFFKKAVVRNLLKRRVRAVLRPFSRKLETPVLVRLLPGADKVVFADLAEDLKKQANFYLK